MEETRSITYKDGYKYQLHSNVYVYIDTENDGLLETEYIILDGNKLSIKKGYCWDGPSGPTKDTKSFMRGSLVHDAIYQLIRMELLSISDRIKADKDLDRICKQDGMGWFRRKYVIAALYFFGGSAANPKNRKKIITSP